MTASEEAHHRNVVTICPTEKSNNLLEYETSWIFDERTLPECVKLYMNVMDIDKELELIRMMNPKYPENPPEDLAIPAEGKNYISAMMKTNYKELIYSLGNITPTEKLNIFTSLRIVSPEEKIKPRSDGFLVSIILGSNEVYKFVKKSTGQEYTVFVPRRSLMIIKDEYLEYVKSIDESRKYRPSPSFPETTIVKGYQYNLTWVLGSVRDRYVPYEASTESSVFVREPLRFLTDLNGQIHISAEEMTRCKKMYSNEEIVKAIQESGVQFPFMKYFVKEPLSVFFDRLKNVDWKKKMDQRAYTLNNRNADLFPMNDPNTFVNVSEDFEQIDCITNFFTEYARMKAIVLRTTENTFTGRLSPYQWWYSSYQRNLLSRVLDGEVNTKRFYDIMTHQTEALPKIVPLFRATLAMTLLQMLCSSKQGNTRYLDLCAGYGDRLISAFAFPCRRYLGYDPNTMLIMGHNEIIRSLYPLSPESEIPKEFEVRCEPFETCALPINERFDLAVFSPPLFHSVIYTEEETQSDKKYPVYEDWLIQFVFQSIKKAWAVLDSEGFFVFVCQETEKTPRMGDIVNLWMQARLPGCEYVGLLTNQLRKEEDISSGPRLPLVIWKKGFGNTQKAQEAEKRLKKTHYNIYSKQKNHS